MRCLAGGSGGSVGFSARSRWARGEVRRLLDPVHSDVNGAAAASKAET